MPGHFPCLLRIETVPFQTKEKPNFADISLFIGRDTYYITSALLCMAKRTAEIFQVIELEQILAVGLLLYFPKNTSISVEISIYSSSEGTILAWAMRLHAVPSCFGDTAFSRECLLKVSLSLVSQPGMGWRLLPQVVALGQQALLPKDQQKIPLVSCRALKG